CYRGLCEQTDTERKGAIGGQLLLRVSIVDDRQQIRKDFAYWRALTKAVETAQNTEERAWFEADRLLREKITLHGLESHYVADASQPLHVSIHYNGWGDFPNPKGYTTKPIHAYFEGEFVKRNLTRSAVASEVPPYQPCAACSIKQSTRALLLESMAEVEPFYALEKEGAFKRGDRRGVAFAVARLATGATALRNMIVEAWEDSATT